MSAPLPEAGKALDAAGTAGWKRVAGCRHQTCPIRRLLSLPDLLSTHQVVMGVQRCMGRRIGCGDGAGVGVAGDHEHCQAA